MIHLTQVSNSAENSETKRLYPLIPLRNLLLSDDEMSRDWNNPAVMA